MSDEKYLHGIIHNLPLSELLALSLTNKRIKSLIMTNNEVYQLRVANMGIFEADKRKIKGGLMHLIEFVTEMNRDKAKAYILLCLDQLNRDLTWLLLTYLPDYIVDIYDVAEYEDMTNIISDETRYPPEIAALLMRKMNVENSGMRVSYVHYLKETLINCNYPLAEKLTPELIKLSDRHNVNIKIRYLMYDIRNNQDKLRLLITSQPGRYESLHVIEDMMREEAAETPVDYIIDFIDELSDDGDKKYLLDLLRYSYSGKVIPHLDDIHVKKYEHMMDRLSDYQW